LKGIERIAIAVPPDSGDSRHRACARRGCTFTERKEHAASQYGRSSGPLL